MDKLTAKDIQDISLAEHTEQYVTQQQRQKQQGEQRGSISEREYDSTQSRQDAFGD